MIHRLASILVFLSLFSTLNAADYCFPSPNPPANLSPSQVKQFVTLIFDDCQYSGEIGTQYEDTAVWTYPPADNYKRSGFVGGVHPDLDPYFKGANPLNLTVGDFGISWAEGPLAGIRPPVAKDFDSKVTSYSMADSVVYHDTLWKSSAWMSSPIPTPSALPPANSWDPHWIVVSTVDKSLTRKNPDGTPIHFTFNFISGLFIPIWGPDWTAYQSKLGFWVPKPIDSMSQTKVAVAWGREQAAGTLEGDSSLSRPFILHSALRAIANGHEIGNHTIDHMETNSPLPKSYFDNWGGSGWDATGIDTMPWGEVVSEATQFGERVGMSAQSMGWKYDAGQMLTPQAWKGLVSLGELQLNSFLGVSVAKGNLHSFRAPRLETNSGEFYALKELGYEYDCGIEEGYEENVNGTNFVWPYTTDNGSINSYTQKLNDEHVYLDSMPTGVWEIPVNCVIVPPALRPAIFSKYRQISAGSVDGDWTKNPATVLQDSLDWVKGINGGKITCFDFNLFILYGLTKDEFVQTMVYNLKQRMAGGKAPFQYGCHPDYYTPIYDNGTLQNNFNKDSYGLVVSKGWNTWKDRKAAVEAFVDSALALGAYVVNGHELINQMRALQLQDKPGSPIAFTPSWTYQKWVGAPTSSVASAQGNLAASITFADSSDDCGFLAPVTAGAFTNLDHISLTYKTNAPLKLKLVLSGNNNSYDVLLNNLGPTTQSGNIPLSAFQKDSMGYSLLPAGEKIIGVEISPQNMGKAPAQFSISNLSFLNGTVGVKNNMMSVIAGPSLGHINAKRFMLYSPAAAHYTAALYSMNGQRIQYINFAAKAGQNRVEFHTALTPANYIVKIADEQGRNIACKTVAICGL